VTLVGGANYSGVDPKKKGIAGAIMAENYPQSDPQSYVTFRPMQHLSYTSKLIDIAMTGKHNNVKLDPLSLRKLIAWIDTNCPYRGEQEIRQIPPLSLRKLIAWIDTNCPYRGEQEIRQIPDPEFPGIDLLPIRPKVATAPKIHRP